MDIPIKRHLRAFRTGNRKPALEAEHCISLRQNHVPAISDYAMHEVRLEATLGAAYFENDDADRNNYVREAATREILTKIYGPIAVELLQVAMELETGKTAASVIAQRLCKMAHDMVTTEVK